MRFRPMGIHGAMLIEKEPQEDERGSFSRLFSRGEFEAHGLMSTFTQESVSRSRRAGTLRGFHFQEVPSEEAKLLSCVRGAAFDVVLDVRKASPTFGKWRSAMLRGEDWLGVYIPPGCAHAVQALMDETEILYRMSCDYDPGVERGYRWDSPELAIPWPLHDPILSERDRALPIFDPRTMD